MTATSEILARMKRNPSGIRFRDLCKVCDRGKAKPYQVRQVLQAIRRLEEANG